MTYFYRRICTSVNQDSLVAAIRMLHNDNNCYPAYVSVLTREKSIGRPLKDVFYRRWFDTVDVPNQMWLPFEEFTPARVIRVELFCRGSGYRLGCELSTGQEFICVHYTNPGIIRYDSIRAIEIYRREEVSENMPPNPDCGMSLSRTYYTGAHQFSINYGVRTEISSELRDILRLRYIHRRLVYRCAKFIDFIEQPTIDENTGFVYDEDGGIILQIIDVSRFDSESIYFTFQFRLNMSHPFNSHRFTENWCITL